MFKKTLFAALLATSFGSAHAYQAEIGGSLGIIDPDKGDTSTGFTIDGTYYFNPVQVKNNPLNEAAFLDRASNVSAGVNYTDYDAYDVTTYGVGIEYFVPNTDFYASAAIGRSTAKADHVDDLDTTTYSAEVGYLPIPGLLVAVGLAGYDNDFNDDIDPTIRAKYVTQVGRYDMNFEGGASFGDIDDYSVGTDLYLDKTFSVGLAYSGSRADGNDEDSITIRAKKFFTQQISLEGSVDFSDDYNIYGLRAAYRF